jgi:hypothetical protein
MRNMASSVSVLQGCFLSIQKAARQWYYYSSLRYADAVEPWSLSDKACGFGDPMMLVEAFFVLSSCGFV